MGGILYPNRKPKERVDWRSRRIREGIAV